MEIGLVATEMQATFAFCLARDLYPAVGQCQAVSSQWTGLFSVARVPENSFHMEPVAGGQQTSAAAFSHSKKGAQEITFLSHQASQCNSKDNTSQNPEAGCCLQLVDLNKTGHRGTLYLGRGWKRWWLHADILALLPTAENTAQSMVSLHSTIKEPIWFLHKEWESGFWMWCKNFWNASFPVNQNFKKCFLVASGNLEICIFNVCGMLY